MGHADNDFLDTLGAGALDRFVQRHDEAFAAFQRETLLTDITCVQIALQSFSRGQAVEDVLFLFCSEYRRRTGRLQAFLHPAFFGRIADVHVLGTDRTAIRIAQRIQQVAQRSRFSTEVGVADVEHDVHVGIGETVEAWFQFW